MRLGWRLQGHRDLGGPGGQEVSHGRFELRGLRTKPERKVSLTRATHFENGSPSSLAKAKSCREEPAMIVIQLDAERMMMKAVMALVAASDPVML